MPTITGNFPVRDGADVRLRVSISEGREGRSSASMDGAELISAPEIDHSLGDGGELRGRVLVVSSTVEALPAQAEWTGAAVRLVSGGTTRELTQRQQSSTGKTVRYVFVITFGGAQDV